MTIINKNAFRLAAIYAVVLAVVCIIFSSVLYNVSLSEFERSLRRPLPRGYILDEQMYQERENVVEEFKSRLVMRTLIVDVLILACGSAVAYIFARKTLEPIEAARLQMEQFTTDAAHDLRTPLAAMKIENEVLLDEKNITSKEAKKQLLSNIEEINKLSAMVENLLMSLRGEKQANHTQQIDVNSVLLAACDTLRPIAQAKGLAYTYTLADTPYVKNVDAMMLERAFAALIDNAVKYTPKDGAVNILARRTTKKMIVKIKDTGNGIAKDDQARIFDRLYRSDTARSSTGTSGHGLGLYIAKKAILDAGGEIRIASSSRKGSVFIVEL